MLDGSVSKIVLHLFTFDRLAWIKVFDKELLGSMHRFSC